MLSIDALKARQMLELWRPDLRVDDPDMVLVYVIAAVSASISESMAAQYAPIEFTPEERSACMAATIVQLKNFGIIDTDLSDEDIIMEYFSPREPVS